MSVVRVPRDLFLATDLEVTIPICGQSVEEPVDSLLQLGKIVIDCGLKDAARGFEVVMRKPVAHARDLTPRDIGFPLHKARLKILDGFADLNQSNAHGVEHQTVVKPAAIEVRSNCREGCQDVLEPVTWCSAHGSPPRPAAGARRRATPG